MLLTEWSLNQCIISLNYHRSPVIGLPLPQKRVNKSVYTKISETQENNGKGVEKWDMLPLDQFGGQNIFENSFLEGIEAKKLTFCHVRKME